MFAARNMVFARSSESYDADAATYFAAIASAGSSITTANKAAVNAFIVGCKADSIWDAIKASCLLAGPDDLTGALVPLVGSAPTNNNFVSGDYSRTLGLTGDGSTKYLNANRNNNADPQDSRHIYARVTGAQSVTGSYIASGGTAGGTLMRHSTSTALQIRCSSAGGSVTTASYPTGGYGVARTNGTTVNTLAASSAASQSLASATPTSAAMTVFANNTPGQYSNARISFYSIGEYLVLATLDARIATLMASLT
jgi:hypothetical protein